MVVAGIGASSHFCAREGITLFAVTLALCFRGAKIGNPGSVKIFKVALWNDKDCTKGQFIWKCLFGVFNFFQKTNEKKSTWSMYHSTVKFFHCFLKEFKIPTSPFEINWPLQRIAHKHRIGLEFEVWNWILHFIYLCIVSGIFFTVDIFNLVI